MRCVALGTLLVLASACGIQVSGDFDGVPWTPDSSLLAVANREQLLDRGGAVVPVTLSDNAQTLSVLLTGARVDVNEDWRGATIDDLLDIQHDLATNDGLLLSNISLAKFRGGGALEAVFENGGGKGDFDVSMGAAVPPADAVKAQGLGSKIRVDIEPKGVTAGPHGGSMSADISVAREREAGQETNVATGTVTLTFSTSFVDERLGTSNLTVAAPILACMQSHGVARAAECKDVASDPVVDETGEQP
jgi:hypothetical protein